MALLPDDVHDLHVLIARLGDDERTMLAWMGQQLCPELPPGADLIQVVCALETPADRRVFHFFAHRLAIGREAYGELTFDSPKMRKRDWKLARGEELGDTVAYTCFDEAQHGSATPDSRARKLLSVAVQELRLLAAAEVT